MRIIWSLLFLVSAGAAHAVPDPAPPPAYSGDQYIDGAGCVFTQKDGKWELRTDRDGNAVCGFPPTLSARRIDPDTDILPPMRPLAEPPGPEQLLREHLASELRQGEFLSDPREVEKRSEPKAADTDDALMEGVRQMLLLRAAVDANLAGDPGDPGLCARLGYVPDLDPHPIPAGDVTAGLCPGQRPARPMERIVMAARQDGGTHQPKASPSGSGHAKAADEAARSVRSIVRAAAPVKAGSGKPKREKKNGPDAATNIVKPEMIPASARYVQVGIFADDASAEPAIHRLRGLGYPVARGYRHDATRRSRVILAGPFKDRRTLVAALNLLRDKGYNAVAH